MTVLKIIGFIAVAIAVLVAIGRFNTHCQNKFSYRFFTTISFVAAAAATWLAMAGYSWYEHSSKNGGDVLNGIVIMIIAGIIAGALIYYGSVQNFSHIL